MSRQHVGHKEIVSFAEARVNLRREDVADHRQQVWRLRDKLEGYLNDHPDFTLRKMMLSGSLAKGTALRTLNDIDVAVYVSGSDVPADVAKLLEYLAEKLRKAFPNFTADQIKPQTYSVTVSFKGSGLDVDVVPILYAGDPDWRGQLVSQDDGSFLETSIPLHLEFLRKRKKEHGANFAQLIRLVKFWARRRKMESDQFRFKSFMIELILAKLADDGMNLSDYPEALQGFFTYIADVELVRQISFTDYYPQCDVSVNAGDRVKIIDPVNCANNVSRLYKDAEVRLISSAAMEAGDAIDWALSAPTKGDTVAAWQDVFGPAFSA
jgi:predicted nucleotidyltransferase